MSVAPSTLNNNGAAITACGIKSGTTALPGTLSVDPTTCTISGIPSAALSATQYHLIATNSAGDSSDATVTLSVGHIPPRVFVGDPNSDYVIACDLNSTTGAMSNCNGTSVAAVPYGVAVTTLNGNLYAFFNSMAGIWRCSVNPSTAAMSCNQASASVLGTITKGMAIQTVSGHLYAYAAEYNGHVYVCTIESNGIVDNCALSNGGVATSAWHPFGIQVYPVGGNYYAYVADTNGNVYVCSVSTTDGTLSGCAVSNGGATFAPYGLLLTTINGSIYAYVADPNNGDVWQCSVNSGTGALSGCAKSDGGKTSGSWAPSGISFATLSGGTYAYVSDGINSTFYTCSVNSTTGALSGCATAAASPSGGWIGPYGVFGFAP